MANLKDIQQRIKSVGSIQKVTKAMKMVAAAKVKRAQERMEISRPYSKNVQDLICRILPEISSSNIDLIEKRDVKKKGFIVITSDRGFAGSFNSSVIRLAEKEVDEIYVIYNRFRNLASQDLMIEKVLPIDFTENYNVKNYNYDYEPSRESTVNILLPKHLKVQMWQQMLESYSSEEAARMIAMDNATENAKEIIKELKLEFNKARQAAITTEMLEIVGGAEALSD